jgi:hypothetical protein
MDINLPIKLNSFNNTSNWISGIIGDYKFEAKHFDVGSEFGIDGGRVSKLSIWKGDSWNDGLIVNYDRGWDIEPTTENQKYIFSCLMNYLEQLPKRFE